MNKNPIMVITGLAVAAVAGIAGLTKDKWMTGAPQQVASTVTATAPEVSAPKVDTPVQPQVTAETPPAQPAVEQPAPAEAAVTPAPPAAEQKAAEQPAVLPEVKAEAPVAAPETEQPKVAETPPAAEQPTVTEVPAAEQQTVAVKPEAPAVEQPTAIVEPEAPAAEQQTSVAQPETPATEQQTAAVQPETPAPAATAAPEVIAPAVAETVPAFDTVRVEKSGEAVIAGTAKAGSEVSVKLDGQTIGTATANADGAFVIIPDAPLPSGSGALTIESKSKGDLQAVQSEQSVAVIIPAEAKDDALVAVVSPNEPTKILQKPQPEPETAVAATQPPAVESQPEAAPEQTVAAKAPPKTVSIDAVDYDNTGNIVFSGQGQAGNTARVYVDNTHAGDAVIGGDGRWNFSGTAAVTAGQHSLRVDGIDATGKVHNRVEVPFFREETSKVAAAAPTEQTTNPDAVKTGNEVAAASPTVNDQITDATPLPPKDGRVVIQPGNNLWRISRVLYGSGDKYTLLYKANKDQIRDPDMIFPGQIFMTPDVSPKVDTIDPKRREPLTPEENAASAQ